MAQFYADEHVPPEITETLRTLGHDVLTVQEDGRANQAIVDRDVLARAILLSRAVVTNNRRDFHRLHRAVPNHAGIVTYTDDPDRIAIANRIDAAINGLTSLAGQLARVLRPNLPRQTKQPP
jgi:predicted nuclease of predicted toxin-antitoxin system